MQNTQNMWLLWKANVHTYKRLCAHVYNCTYFILNKLTFLNIKILSSLMGVYNNKMTLRAEKCFHLV